ncbi:hypothetical protein SNOG_03962 [Parastagonospora nodorum SN15]|uniref:Uncharacterized protein n=1 Tax=Phaeosphaeria nodorum (strain SN15 / ATCC MYA-4574 / FGSC 10173) TaxID=321614 RepID=Q0UWA2_PHANO|nr:hypothetical protein SNOG_03962 [Parastagonospora nodorum SN15]EAT89167.1 hypothetical protein SNOG_03962 [Parastagonospora nodorum SN15]
MAASKPIGAGERAKSMPHTLEHARLWRGPMGRLKRPFDADRDETGAPHGFSFWSVWVRAFGRRSWGTKRCRTQEQVG